MQLCVMSLADAETVEGYPSFNNSNGCILPGSRGVQPLSEYPESLRSLG